MAVFTVFFVVLAIHFGHWGLLFCYFVIGVVPAVAFCFYVIGSQQLWDVNYIADILFLSKSSMVTKLQALGPLISSVHKGHADETDGEIDHGTQHTEETTKSLLNIINSKSSSSSSNNNALTTTKITSTVDTTEKPTSFNSFPVVDNVPTLFPQCFPLSSSQGLTPDTPVSCSREIECEIEKYVNLITRDFVQSWYKMVCAEPDIVEEIHDKIHAIMTDLYRRVRNINRRSVFVETIIMYREQLTKFQTALATFKIQMTYGMNKTNQKQNLPSSLEDAFNLKYTQHPAAKDREGSIEHIKALFEIMINCMDVFPTEFKDITSMKEMLIEILTMQVAIPLLDMLEDPIFLHESIILLLSDTPVDFTNLIPSADNQPPHPLPPETIPVSTDTIKDICVVETETRKESRSNGVYTLYQIQYDALYVTESGELALKSGEVKRRFREFLNLQLRLEEKRAYKKILKGIKGPKRWLCIPFGNMDQENVAQRKKFLDNYLKNLIKKEDICNGPELKEFLAYEGDAHIAFVRKAPEINVPRIDKAFVKTVSGVLDKLTNVLPRGLSQEKMTLTGGAVIRKDSTSSNKSNEVSKCLEDTDQLLFDFNIPNDDIWSINIASGLQNYIKSIKGHNSTDNKLPSPDLSEQVPLTSETSIKKLTSLSKSNASDITDSSQVTTQATPDPVLSSAVLDLATQALQGCDSWVCKESSYRSIQVIFGTVLDRCLQQKLDRMTSRSQCLNYLQLLREKIWPNGKLSMQPPPQKSPAEIQATKELAHQCLKEYFPRILYFAIGEDNLNHGIVQLLAAIQYKKLNRHFIFCLVDALFLHLFPEVKNKSFQQNILRCHKDEFFIKLRPYLEDLIHCQSSYKKISTII
ncbi:SNX19 [Acanthosepion pharaonis]|uniref:SNX19 n=1 Tax=Acanthosepion pharaonis TaxID=158019 RepID=A0A812B0W4_ACAPH|nr:SNX19 [Sepia pharaonis]